MRKVFIAGGTGMLGAQTALALAKEGIKVVVSSRKKKDKTGDMLMAASDLIEVAKVDLKDSATLKSVYEAHNFDGVVFLAQTHQHALSREMANQIYPILTDCLEYARQTKVKRFVFGSSIAIYGGCMPPFDEQQTFSTSVPVNPIGVKFEASVKRVLETIALDYGQPFEFGLSILPENRPQDYYDFEVVSLRSSAMFGPGYYALGSPLGVGAHFAAGRLDKFEGYIGYAGLAMEDLWPGAAKIPTSYVKDNADCIKIALLADTIPNPIYNICSGFPCDAPLQYDALIEAAPHIKDSIGVVREMLPADIDLDLGFNNSLFRQDFGWTPKYTLTSALEEYIAYLKDNPI